MKRGRFSDTLEMFAFGGALVTVLTVYSAIHGLRFGPMTSYGSLTPQWVLLAGTAIAYAAALLVMRFVSDRFLDARFARVVFFAGAGVRVLLALANIGITVTLAGAAHRYYLLLVAAAQAVIAFQIWNASERRTWRFAALCIASACAWVFTAGITSTSLANLFLNATLASDLVLLVFGASLVLIVLDLGAADAPAASRPHPFRGFAEYAGVGAVCLLLALRTDDLLTDWIPYHRSYWVGPAEFVRAGHWLLWDVPTQYGFLSELALALAPGRNVWQSLYLTTAVVMLLQALVLFALLRRPGAGIVNFIVAFAAALAFNVGALASRSPFGARFYPQMGMRFLWLIALVFVIYLIHANWETPKTRRRLVALGHFVWAASLLWAFECAVWSSVVWFAYVIVSALCELILAGRKTSGTIGAILVRNVLPVLVIPPLLFGVVEGFYQVRLGHRPDWLSYLEFSALYNSDPASIVFAPQGSIWLVPALLAALGGLGLLLVREGRTAKLPAFVAFWCAVWVVSSYYFGEHFSNHINAILPVFATAAAAALRLIDPDLRPRLCTQAAIASIVPMFVIVGTTTFGGAFAEIRAAQFDWFDSTASFPVLSGELAAIVKQAGIQSDDKVAFPNSSSWAKIDVGVIMPFERDRDGKIVERISWLPTSPVGPSNTFYSLSPARQQTYMDRFLDREPNGGWVIWYRELPDCKRFSPRLETVRTVTSRNYSAALCAVRPRTS